MRGGGIYLFLLMAALIGADAVDYSMETFH
jgi:hypothetical protein